jgi:hypothetical protein
MNESKVVSSPRHLTSKNVHVKLHGRFEIANAKNDMVEALSIKWDHVLWSSDEAAKSSMTQSHQAYSRPIVFPKMPCIGRAVAQT